MADHSRSTTTSHVFYTSFGLGSICKACKSFVSKCYPERILSPNKKTQPHKDKIIRQLHKDSSIHKSSIEEVVNDVQNFNYHDEASHGGVLNHRTNDNYYYASSPISSPPMSRNTSPSRLRRTFSRILRTTSGKGHNLSSTKKGGVDVGNGDGDEFPCSVSRNVTSAHNANRRNSLDAPSFQKAVSRSTSRRNSVDAPIQGLPASSFSRSASRRVSTPIMFSNSNGLVKPPPMEKILECTLEELCFGCVKKIKIIRDAVTDDGHIVQEEEVLTIKVKPGWTKGTKVTFEGMGNETPGTSPADIIFVVTEKRHHLFRREGDDLELAVEIPLIKALTGCNLTIPLLGGETMDLSIDDVICPGYEKIIAGQGMPKPNKEQGNRGNLVLTFLVQFPEELTEEQRSDVVRILQESC